MNLILLGYRGTGKTTVARLLALRIGWPWFDADVEVELRAGKSIALLFSQQGEPAFRDLESKVITELCAGDQRVLALGGGAVVRAENRAVIRAAGKSVWLTASPETLWNRIVQDEATAQQRPKLTRQGGLEEIRQVLAARAPFYRECAKLEVDTQDKTPAQVADEIIGRLALSPSSAESA